MRRFERKHLLAVGLLLSIILAVAGCGGGSHHKPRPFTVEKVVQPHVIASPVPQPGQHMPAAVVPAPVPKNVRARAVAKHAAVVSHVALKVPAHVAGHRVHFAGDLSTATVEQFDSVTVPTIPLWAHYVAGYVDGSWPTYWQIRGRWPVAVGIAVQTNHGADCLDMEPGNPGPSSAGPWAKWQFSQGNDRPCEYSMLSWFPQINANLSANGVAVCSLVIVHHCVREWDANWTYSRHLDSGYYCTQWTDKAYGLNLDESTCLLSFYGTPKPPGPSGGQVRGWIAARGGSLHAYYAHGCRKPVLTSGTCGQLAWRVDHFQKLIDTAHGYFPRCFGGRRNVGAAECQIVRPAVAVWSRARSSTASAGLNLRCGGIATWGLPKSSRACKALNQRYGYFDRRARRGVGTSRY